MKPFCIRVNRLKVLKPLPRIGWRRFGLCECNDNATHGGHSAAMQRSATVQPQDTAWMNAGNQGDRIVCDVDGWSASTVTGCSGPTNRSPAGIGTRPAETASLPGSSPPGQSIDRRQNCSPGSGSSGAKAGVRLADRPSSLTEGVNRLADRPVRPDTPTALPAASRALEESGCGKFSTTAFFLWSPPAARCRSFACWS